jgi:hypothetical protein
MRRRLFTVLSALSLLLFVAVVVLWVWTYRHTGDTERFSHGQGRYPYTYWEVCSWDGQLLVSRFNYAYVTLGSLGWERTHHQSSPAWDDVNTGGDSRGWWQFRGNTGFGIDSVQGWTVGGVGRDGIRQPDRRGGRFWAVYLKHWHLAAAFAALPLCRALPAAWRMWKNRLVARVGMCPRCGYDLRATPGRCPECGTVPAGKEA